MKIRTFSKIFLTIAALLFVTLVISGCSDSITNSNVVSTPDKYQALTEAQFSRSSSLSAIPGQVLYLDLESAGSPATGDDTGINGTDEISYTVSDNAIYRFQLGANAKFIAKLTDWTGGTVFQLNNAFDTTRINLNPGNYKLTLISTSTALKPQTVFFQPDVNAIKSGKGVRKDGIKPQDLNTLLETGMCEECNLKNIDIENKNMSSVRFLKSDLTASYFRNVHFDSAYFYKTKLDSVTSDRCGLSYSKFDSCTAVSYVALGTLKGAVFNGCNFYYSSIEGNRMAPSTNAIFRNSSFIRMIFLNVNLDSSQFTNVILAGSVSDNSNFNYAVFKDVIFDTANVYKMVAQNALFENVSMNQVKFSSCNFTKSIFRNCKCKQISFAQSDMTDTYLTSCNFYGGFFGGILNRTTLIGSDIRDAYFCQAQIQNITAYNNIKDENTVCFPY